MAVTNAAASSITAASTTTTTTTVKFVPFAPDHCCTPVYIAEVTRYILSGVGGAFLVYLIIYSLFRQFSKKAQEQLVPVKGVLVSAWPPSILILVLSLVLWGVILWLTSLWPFS